MKKTVFVMAILMFLLSACSGRHIVDEVKETDRNKGIQTAIDIDELKRNNDILCNDDDMEENVNLLSLDEDENLTQQAEDNNYTEYDVIIDEMQKKEVKLESKAREIGYEVIEVFDSGLPPSVDANLIYDRYDVTFNYVVVMGDDINVREKPTVASPVVGTAYNFEKINVLSEVKGQFLESFGSDIWYEIAWKDFDKVKVGYIFKDFVERRTFRLDDMVKAAEKLRKEVENRVTAYISNYRDRNGSAPQWKGKDEDQYGTLRYESAPAYTSPKKNADFRYLPDGTLVTVISASGDYYEVKVPGHDSVYFVPKKYISGSNLIEELSQVVVIDTRNQNEVVLRYFKDKWQIVSYTYATTGSSEGASATRPGIYVPIQKRKIFNYTNENGEILGYVPYSIRFSGSAYIHGIPVKYEKKDGEITDPGMKEYLFTLGTIPRTNKTVRNYTSHAKFLYEWLELGKSAIIVLN